MLTCPHCGKEIEVKQTTDVSWWQYDPGRGTSLGCGTLIIIAIIVAMFSRGGADDIRELRKDIQSLEKKIDLIQLKPVAAVQPDESREVRQLGQEPQALNAKLENGSAARNAIAPAVSQNNVPLAKPQNEPSLAADQNNLPKLQKLATGVREAMTTESILKMEKWNRIDAGLSSDRELAKARAGAPYFKDFYLIGENAKDTLRSLISDENEDVRRSSTLLLQQWPYLQKKMEQSFIDLAKNLAESTTVPLLEEALQNQDAEVRYNACCGLGDLTYFDSALEKLYRSVPKIQALRQDPVIEVRGIAYTVCGIILRVVSEKAKDPNVRSKAQEDHEKYLEQGKW